MRLRVAFFGVAVLALTSAFLPAGLAVPAEPSGTGGTLEVTVREGRLSVDLRDAPLAEVLRLVGDRADVQMNLSGEFRTSLTRAFTDVPIEEGLRRLARGHSLSFAYAPLRDGQGAARLTEVWVVASSPATRPAGRVESSQRAAQLATLRALGQRRDEAAVTELSRTLVQDPDPAVRAQAATVLSQISGAPAAAALIEALGDETPSVRIQAIHGLRRIEGDQVADLLGRVLLSDPDPSVRRVAASTLGSLRSGAAGWR
jgi:HEAT repeats/HEAT repeat